MRAMVKPGDDDSDPNIHVEETLIFTLGEKRAIDKSEVKSVNESSTVSAREPKEESQVPDWKVEGGLHMHVTVMIEDERNGGHHILIGDLDEDMYEDDEELNSEEQADRMAMEMQLAGENPDEEIDKLLETLLDVQVGANLASSKFFNGEFIANDIRLGAELRQMIGECE